MLRRHPRSALSSSSAASDVYKRQAVTIAVELECSVVDVVHDGIGAVVGAAGGQQLDQCEACLLYTSPSPRDGLLYRMPSSA